MNQRGRDGEEEQRFDYKTEAWEENKEKQTRSGSLIKDLLTKGFH